MKKIKQHEMDEYKTGWQRCQADFENFRRRVEQDKASWSRAAKMEVLGQILPILDNLNLASAHVPQELAGNQWVQGINHIAKQIEAQFDELGIEKITPEVGSPFDHNIHEAVATGVSKKLPDNSIMELKSSGFRVEGALLRPAKVIVSKN